MRAAFTRSGRKFATNWGRFPQSVICGRAVNYLDSRKKFYADKTFFRDFQEKPNVRRRFGAALRSVFPLRRI